MQFKLKVNNTQIDFFSHEQADNNSLIKNILSGKTYPLINIFEPRVIFDIGANIGATSVFFALNYPKAKIFSFEPTSMNFNLLKKNVKNLKNVIAFNRGVFDKDVTEKIYLDRFSPGRNSIFKRWTNSEEFEQIKLINLHKFVKENKIDNIDILKIDTEGCEVPILKSISHFFPSIKLIYLEYHSKEDKKAIENLLGDTHFVVRDFLVGEDKINLDESALDRKCIENVYLENKLIIKKGEILEEKHLQRLTPVREKILVRSLDLGEIVYLNKIYRK